LANQGNQANSSNHAQSFWKGRCPCSGHRDVAVLRLVCAVWKVRNMGTSNWSPSEAARSRAAANDDETPSLARAIFSRFSTACGDIPRSLAISFAVWGRSRRRKHSFSFAVNLASAILPGSSVRMLSVSLMKMCYRSNVCLPRTFRDQNAKLTDFVSAQRRQEHAPADAKTSCIGQAHSVEVPGARPKSRRSASSHRKH
jgi:hypothetical protein